MNNPASDGSETSPLWQFVPLRDYQRPTAPARTTFRLGYRYVLSQIKLQRNSKEKAQDAEFQVVPSEWLACIAPTIAWDDAVAELTNSLNEWELEGSTASAVQVIIGPPGGGSLEIASRWAEQKGWSVVPTPTVDQVFNGSVNWLDQYFINSESPRVLLGLEHYYLRHQEGLELVRRLKEILEETQTRCLVQCDSWGWAYLGKALGLTSSLPEPWVLKALDIEQLRQWLRCIKAPSGSPQQVLEIGSDKLVMSFEDAGQSQSTKRADDSTVSNYLEYLARHSRGIPEVALEIWRLGLKIPNNDETAGLVAETGTNFEGQALWVSPWAELELPKLPADITQCEALLLHAILIHGGLGSEVIPKLIPFARHEIMQSLHRLRYQGLVEDEHGSWRVTLLGYPSVRQYLNNQGFLVDYF